MPSQLQRRRGTTAEHAAFTGAEGEITVDTDKKTAVVHDGATPGGFPLVKESALAATGGAGLVVTIQSGTGAVARTAEEKLREIEVSPQDYMNAEQKMNAYLRLGTIDSRAAIQAAINRLDSIGGGTLKAHGAYRVDGQIDLKPNITYDLADATFTKGGAAFDYLMKGDLTDNVTIIGGTFLKASGAPTITVPTGTYSYATAIAITRSKNIRIRKSSFEEQFVSVDLYNCSDAWVTETRHLNCNASIAVVVNNSATEDSARFWLIDNTFIGGGDDGIAICPVDTAYNITDIVVRGNVMDKTRHIVNAAVGIRLGRYGTGTGKVYRAKVSENIMKNMTRQGLFAHDLYDSEILFNTVDGYAREAAAPAYVLGQAGKPVDNLTFFGNKAINPTAGKGFGMLAEALTNSEVMQNKLIGNHAAIGCAYVQDSQYNKIKGNEFQNTDATSGATFQMVGTSDYADISDNDFSKGSGTLVSLTGSNNRIKSNRGYVSEAKGRAAAIVSGGTIAHGLAKAPDFIDITPFGVAGPPDFAVASINGTTFAVYWTGGSSQEFFWHASIAESV